MIRAVFAMLVLSAVAACGETEIEKNDLPIPKKPDLQDSRTDETLKLKVGVFRGAATADFVFKVGPGKTFTASRSVKGTFLSVSGMLSPRTGDEYPVFLSVVAFESKTSNSTQAVGFLLKLGEGEGCGSNHLGCSVVLSKAPQGGGLRAAGDLHSGGIDR